jgi:hypothetical protein
METMHCNGALVMADKREKVLLSEIWTKQLRVFVS